MSHSNPIRKYCNKRHWWWWYIKPSVKHNSHDVLTAKRPREDTSNTKPEQQKTSCIPQTQSYQPLCGSPCNSGASHVMHDSPNLISNRQLCHLMSINYSLREVTVFQKDYAAAALWLPWSVTLCIIWLPNVRCTFEIIFSSICAVNAQNKVWTDYVQCAERHFPSNVHKRLESDDNYHVMIVIRISATHLHKESSNDATESQKYCLRGL